MPVIKLEEAQTFGVLPVDTILQVEVEEVNERFVEGKNGKDGWNKIEFKFLILDVPTALQDEYGTLIGTRIWGSVSARLTDHPDNKLRQWSEALLGMSVNEPGFELDTDILVNRKARAVVSQYTKRDGTSAHQVAALLPSVAQTATPTITAPAPTQAPATQPEPVGVSALTFDGGDDSEPPF